MKDNEFQAKVTTEFQDDPQKIKLLSIFKDQIQLIAKEEQPSLSHFLDLLEAREIVPPAEVSKLRISHGLKTVSLPIGSV